MGDVATAPTIQITVVDEQKGTKANCKLYRTEKLSEILRKYNSRLHTSYDSIMVNNAPVLLSQTPALLGLEDGQVLKFCKTQPMAVKLSTSQNGVSSAVEKPRKSTGLDSSSLMGNGADRVTQLEQRLAALEFELESANKREEVLQSQIVGLENKVTEEQEKTQCRICFDRYRDTVIFPCLHFSYCNKCLDDLSHSSRARECPTCRGHISGILRMQIG